MKKKFFIEYLFFFSLITILFIILLYLGILDKFFIQSKVNHLENVFETNSIQPYDQYFSNDTTIKYNNQLLEYEDLRSEITRYIESDIKLENRIQFCIIDCEFSDIVYAKNNTYIVQTDVYLHNFVPNTSGLNLNLNLEIIKKSPWQYDIKNVEVYNQLDKSSITILEYLLIEHK